MRINKDYFVVALFVLMLIPLATAGLGTFKQNSCVDIKTILNSSWANISSISYPNSTVAYSNVGMTKSGQTFNYTFCNTSDMGTYTYDYFDNNGDVYVNDFIVNFNGSDAPSGTLVAIFIVLFCAFIAGFTYVIIFSLGHLAKVDFDILDLATNFGVYFVGVAMFYFNEVYVGSSFMHDILLMFVKIGVWLFVVLPSIYLVFTMVAGSMAANKMKGVDYE